MFTLFPTFSKKVDVKKSKTALIYKNVVAPAKVPRSPVQRVTDAATLGLSVSPIGPEFVKRLTTSTTLDRRNSQRKPKPHLVPISDAQKDGGRLVGTSSLPPTADKHSRKDHHKVKSAPLVSSSPEAVKPGEKKKKAEPPFSKISILSSYFEHKAAQQAGHSPHASAAQQFLPRNDERNRK